MDEKDLARYSERLRSQLEASGVPSHIAEIAAKPEHGLIEHGEGAFRHIASNPSLLSRLPDGAGKIIQDKIYDSVIPSIHSAVESGHINRSYANQLLNRVNSETNSPQDRDSAFSELRTTLGRLSSGPSARENAKREAHRQDQALKILEDTRREILSPLANKEFNGGRLVVDSEPIFIQGQPHLSVGYETDQGRIWSTHVTATKTGEYKDENGVTKDRRQIYADNVPLLPVMGISKGPNGELTRSIGFTQTKRVNGKIESNVFTPTSEEVRPGNLAYQRTSVWQVLAGGGDPGKRSWIDKSGKGGIADIVKGDSHGISSRIDYAKGGAKDSDDTVTPRNWGQYYPPVAESTQNKVLMHSKVGTDEMLGAEPGKLYSNKSVIHDLNYWRSQPRKKVPQEVAPWLNKKNPVTGEEYDYVASPHAMLGSEYSSRNSSYGALKPLPDAPGTSVIYDKNGLPSSINGPKGAKKGDYQKGLKAWQLGRPQDTFFDKTTGDELPWVDATGISTAYGNQQTAGHLLTAAFVNSGSLESDGGVLVSPRLGVQRENTFSLPEEFQTPELERLNALTNEWLRAGKNTSVLPGTDKERDFATGFDSALIKSVDNINGSGVLNVSRRGAAFATDNGGMKAFGVSTNKVDDYGADLVYNKIGDTQAAQFNALNSMFLARPDEFAAIMNAQFDPRLRHSYLSGNSALTDQDIEGDVRRTKGGQFDFSPALKQDWMKGVQWNEDNHELMRAAAEDLWARHTQEVDHTQDIAREFLPMFAPPEFLTDDQRKAQNAYFGGRPVPGLVTGAQNLDNGQVRVTVRQSVTTIPWLTSPEAVISGDHGTVSAVDAMGLTRSRDNDPEVLKRLQEFGLDRFGRKTDIMRTAALNEGANVKGLSEFVVGASISPTAAAAYMEATNAIPADDKNKLEKRLQFYNDIILGGTDKATLIRAGDKRGFFMPAASSIMPMIKGTEDEYVGKEAENIVNALHEQVRATANGNTIVDQRIAERAAKSLSAIAAKEGTRDAVTGRSSSAGSYKSVGSDPKMPVNTIGMSDEDYLDYIHKNLTERGHKLTREEVRGLIRTSEDQFTKTVAEDGIHAALNAGILPVAPTYRSPDMTLDQPVYSSLVSQSLANRLNITDTVFQNGQMITAPQSQMQQKGDYDKDAATIAAGMLNYSPERGMFSTIKPTPQEDVIAASMNPDDPAKQGATWLEIFGDYAGKGIMDTARSLMGKQSASASASDALASGSAITTQSKKNMGAMFNMTLGMRAWWGVIGGKAKGSARQALDSEEIMRAFEYQLVLDTNPVDPSGADLSQANRENAESHPTSIIGAFLKTDPDKHRVSAKDVARMIVPVDAKGYKQSLNFIERRIQQHWDGKIDAERAEREISGHLFKKGMNAETGNSFASFFYANQILNSARKVHKDSIAYGTDPEDMSAVDGYFKGFGANEAKMRSLADNAARIQMMIGEESLLGGENMSAKDVIAALSHNQNFFPADEAGNQMLQGTVDALGINAPTMSPLEQYLGMWNSDGNTAGGVEFNFGTSGSGNGDGNGSNKPPLDNEYFEPPPDPDDGPPLYDNVASATESEVPLDALAQNYANGGNPSGGQPANLPGSKGGSPVLPPNVQMNARRGGQDRFHLKASALNLRGVLSTLSGAGNIGGSEEGAYGQVLARVPFDAAKGTWNAFDKTPGLGQKILGLFGLTPDEDLARQGKKQSLMYDAKGENFTAGMEWKSKSGESLWVNGHAAHVSNDTVFNMSFAKANMSGEDKKQRDMQMFAYMQATGTRKAKTAFFSLDSFHETMNNHFGVDRDVYSDEDKFTEWVNAGGDAKLREKRQKQLAVAYEDAHLALPEDQRFGEWDYTDDAKFNEAKSQFDAQMEENLPYVQAFASAQTEAHGASNYVTDQGTFDGTDGRPYIPMISKEPSFNTPAGVADSLNMMNSRLDEGQQPKQLADALHPAQQARMTQAAGGAVHGGPPNGVVPPNAGGQPPSGGNNPPVSGGSPLGSRNNPVTAKLYNPPGMKKAMAQFGIVLGKDAAGDSFNDQMDAIKGQLDFVEGANSNDMSVGAAKRVVRLSKSMDAVNAGYTNAKQIIADSNNGEDIEPGIVRSAQSVVDKVGRFRGTQDKPTAFDKLSHALSPELVARATGTIEASLNADPVAKPPKPKAQVSDLVGDLKTNSQIDSIAGGANQNLHDVIKSLHELGGVSQKTAEHATNLSSKIVDAGKSTAGLIQTLEKATFAAGQGDKHAAQIVARAEAAGIWENGSASGKLATRKEALFDKGLVAHAMGMQEEVAGLEAASPEFRDKLAPFLMGGRAGRRARNNARDAGQYGAEGSAERAAWEVGGAALGVANRAVLGFRMFRNMSSELIAPLQQDEQFYQQTDRAMNRGFVSSGAVGLGGMTSQEATRIAIGNGRYDQQRAIGKSFEQAWSPFEKGLAGAQAGGFLGEMAAIGGPTIAAGMAATFASGGNPIAGAVVGGLTAATGIFGSMTSAASDQMQRGLISGDLSKDSFGSIGKNGLFKSAGVGANVIGKWLSGDTKGIMDDLSVANSVDLAAGGDSVGAAGNLTMRGNPGGLVANGSSSNPTFSADFMAAYGQKFLDKNATAIGNVSKESQQKGLTQAQAVYGMANSSNQADIIKMIQLAGAGDLNGVDTSGYANLTLGARGMMANSGATVNAMSGMFQPLMNASLTDSTQLPLAMNMVGRAGQGVSYAAKNQRIYGNSADQTAFNLFGAADPYYTGEEVQAGADYVVNSGILSPFDTSNPNESGKQVFNRKKRDQAVSKKFDRLAAAGLLSSSEELAQARAATLGVDRNDPNAMAGIRNRAGTFFDDKLDEGLSTPQAIAASRGERYAGQANAIAAQGGSRGFTAAMFSGLRDENAQGLFGVAQAQAAQGAAGFGVMRGTFNAAQSAFRTNTDAGIALGNRLTSQGVQVGQMYQSAAIYGGSSSFAAFDAIGSITDPVKYGQATAIARGDQMAVSQIGASIGNDHLQTIQTSGTLGAPRGYDVRMGAAMNTEQLNRGLRTSNLSSYNGSFGATSASEYASMTTMERETFGNQQQVGLRNSEFDLANRQMSRQQQSQTAGWGFEDRSIALSREQQDYNYGIAGQRIALNQQQSQYSYSFQKESMGINRQHQVAESGWQMEDIGYQKNMSQVQFGFSMIDADENIRYSTGRQRRTAMRHRDEATVTQSMQMGQMDKEEDRAKERIKWASDLYDREKKNFEANRSFQLADQQLSAQSHAKEREFMTQERQLQDQKIAFERRIAQEEMADNIRSLQIHQQFRVTMDNLSGSANVAHTILTEDTTQLSYLAANGTLANISLMMLNGTLGTLPATISQMISQIQGSTSTYVQPATQNGTVAPPVVRGTPFDAGGYVNSLPSFGAGGYTGDVNVRQPAGVVHGKEFVVPEHGALAVHSGLTDEKLDKVIDVLERIHQDGGNAMFNFNVNEPQKAMKQGLSLYDKAYAN